MRRAYFQARGAVASEHHSTDVPVARLSDREADQLYRLARSGELLPTEAMALEGHLLWEIGRMAADDGLMMALYPPAGFHAGPLAASGHDDRGVADRVRPLLTDFGAAPAFRLRLFTIDTEAYGHEILPLAAAQPALTAVPPTRFADDPATLRAVRVAAVETVGSGRSLGIVDDMSGPFALALPAPARSSPRCRGPGRAGGRRPVERRAGARRAGCGYPGLGPVDARMTSRAGSRTDSR